jgi:hypothetical protein
MVVAITTRKRIMRRGLYLLLGVLLVPTVGLVGDIVTDGKLKSTTASGPPLQVASSSMVDNLNADMVDGVEGTDLYTKTQVDALITAAVTSARPKRFYLTDTGINAEGVLAACGAGFHFASLWEIAEPSNLQYAYDRLDAATRADSGNGPPSGYSGWIRTGFAVDDSNDPGRANCDQWWYSFSSYGTIAKLSEYWDDPAFNGWALVWGTPWAAKTADCDASHLVWCVDD